VVRHGLVPEPRFGDAGGEAVEVHGAVVEIGQGQRCHGGVVSNEVAFGHRGATVAAGEQHLVEVGELQLGALEFPDASPTEGVEGRQFIDGGRSPSIR